MIPRYLVITPHHQVLSKYCSLTKDHLGHHVLRKDCLGHHVLSKDCLGHCVLSKDCLSHHLQSIRNVMC